DCYISVPIRASRRPPLFPSTTLFRSAEPGEERELLRLGLGPGRQPRLAPLQRLELATQSGTDPRVRRLALQGPIQLAAGHRAVRSEEHTSELQSREISYAVFCLKKKI